jgi:NAD(P)-dependent dehydrogenase (short-subunit alcohol dehydrogenase family)
MTGAFEETSLAEARAMFDVNLFGAAAMMQAVLPAMRARRSGWIVNITSMSGHAPWGGTAWYGATKYALECLGQALAQEVAHLGIRVMNVAPGGLRTDFAGRSLGEAALSIADYEPSAHNARRVLDNGRGKEGGDPVAAAAAILRVMEAPDAPLILFLGEDSIRHVGEFMDEVRDDMAKWAETSLSITRPA